MRMKGRLIMTDDPDLDKRIRSIQAEYEEEEAEAAELEAAENTAALDVPLSLRITKELDTQLRQRAAREQIPTSALVRRLLDQAVTSHGHGVFTVDEIEEIARRVYRESA